ncbi:UNVERIFIED_CONTAM: DUF6080 domain-containing protein, partial [Prevotella sp. 15_C9]
KDLSVSRPTFIRYDWAISYIFEAFVFLLFAAGVFYSRHSRLMWMCLSCAAFDAFLHLVLGFGLNEVYIMAGHWIYAIPIAIGFLLKQKRQQPNQELQLRQQLYSRCLKGVLLVLGLALLIYNGILIIGYFC